MHHAWKSQAAVLLGLLLFVSCNVVTSEAAHANTVATA